MKRKLNILTNLLTMAVSFALFSGCPNLGNNTPDIPDTQTPASGIIKVAVSLGEGISDKGDISPRSAVPSGFPNETGTEFVFAGAVHADGTAVTAAMLKTVTYKYDASSKKSSVEIPFEVSSTDRTKLTIYAFPHGTEISSSTNLSDDALLVGSITISIPANAASVSILENTIVEMKPNNANNSAKGFVNLAVKIPKDYFLFLQCNESGLTYEKATSANGNNIEYKVKNTDPAGISAKAYNVTFSIRKTENAPNSTVFAWSETINVFPGLTTDKWNNNSVGSISADGKTRVISNITLFSTFYVRGEPVSGTDSWFTSFGSANGDDDNGTGSLAKPFATVRKAVEKILAINDGTTEYTIYVDGTVTESSTIECKPSVDLNLTIAGLVEDNSKNIVKPAASNQYIFDFDSTNPAKVSATLKNISLTGANVSDGNKFGGAIFASASTKIVFDNVHAYGNRAAYGGVIFSGGDVTLQNGTVFGDKTRTAAATSSNYSNYAKYNSGAIGMGAGTLTIKSGCYVAYNYSQEQDGGGICVQGGCTVIIADGAYIQYNGAERNGGGISLDNADCKATISGNIIGNNATGKGKGIYSNGTLEMSGSVQIAGDNDIYLPAEKYITIAGDLTATGTVARISLDNGNASVTPPVPSQYAVGTTVLQAATTGANGTALFESAQKSLISSNIEKFILNEPNNVTTTNTEFLIKADGTKAVLAKTLASATIELPKEKYTLVLHKADGTASGVEFGADDTVSVGDEITFTVKDSSGEDVTDSVTSFSIIAKHNGNDISSAFSGMITNPSGTAPATKLSEAKIKIPDKLAKTKADIECYVSFKIDGVKYDSSATVKNGG